ncbi:hypothetical protein [Streptomyces sp. NBC_01306]|uniref:hypothetical protein n=1 Tax=Streptomyces sp. NBC_01306 TaxID=2903819 RepID=UPI0022537FD7|nr:hypothetical protein [Streptomyces sp. NBC_01306]MCX4729195.1 hypothetical protein [Streptomyces sp. NBC_01306]
MRNPTHLLIGALAAAVVTLSLSGCGTNASSPHKPNPSGSGGGSGEASPGAARNGAGGASGANGGKGKGREAAQAGTKGLDPCKALSGKLGKFQLDSPVPAIPETGERGCNYMFQGASGPAVTINYWDTKAWKDVIVGGAGAPKTAVTIDGRQAKQTRSTGPGLCDVIVPLGQHSTAEAEARGHSATSKDPVCKWAKDAAREMVTKLPR